MNLPTMANPIAEVSGILRYARLTDEERELLLRLGKNRVLMAGEEGVPMALLWPRGNHPRALLQRLYDQRLVHRCIMASMNCVGAERVDRLRLTPLGIYLVLRCQRTEALGLRRRTAAEAS